MFGCMTDVGQERRGAGQGPDCPPVVCLLYCENGLAVDENGCEICQCVEENCGGFLGLVCDVDQYCDYPDDSFCGAADQLGVCRQRPEVCTMDVDPVCGCDGETWSNACVANSAGVDVAHDGPCMVDDCAALGGECLSDPMDPTFGANCEALGRETLNAECPFFNQACCGPVEEPTCDPACEDDEICVPGVCYHWCQADDPNCCEPDQCVPVCPPVMCMLYCENGFKRDENGCEICECEEGCADIGGQCLSSPFDPTWSADCEAEYGMQTADASCPAMNQACCLP